MISVYIGNLPYDTTEGDVVALFEQFGVVNRAALVTDRETGRPRGFGFVEMANDDEARKAIEGLSGKDYEGRPLTVNEARNRSAQRNSANLSRSAHKSDASDNPPEPNAPDDASDDAANQAGPPADTSSSDTDSSDPDDTSSGYRNDMGKS